MVRYAHLILLSRISYFFAYLWRTSMQAGWRGALVDRTIDVRSREYIAFLKKVGDGSGTKRILSRGNTGENGANSRAAG